MNNPTDIEKGFNGLFQSLGFCRVSELVGESPSFENADYVRQKDHLIVELKVLDKDYFQHGGIIDRFCAIVPAHVRVQPDGTGIYTVTMPDQNREGRSDTFEEPLRRVLKKANRQLKETNRVLFESKGRGFVVLVMNGFRSLAPTVVARMISELLALEFSGISGFVLCASLPEVWSISSMAADLSETEYDTWYSIAEQIGDYLELDKIPAEQDGSRQLATHPE
jgi:hypothetical protein